jgi:hypothetical protein
MTKSPFVAFIATDAVPPFCKEAFSNNTALPWACPSAL